MLKYLKLKPGYEPKLNKLVTFTDSLYGFVPPDNRFIPFVIRKHQTLKSVSPNKGPINSIRPISLNSIEMQKKIKFILNIKYRD